jgi:cell division protein FtsB
MAANTSQKKAVDPLQKGEQALGRLRKPGFFPIAMFVLLVLFIYLQAILWIGEGSFAEVWRLKQSITELEKENQVLLERNQKLIDEVEALRNGLDLIEHRAREDLGLVKENEVFYHVIKEPESKK